MPQLNPEYYLSQLFWFIVTFFFLLIFLWRISLPRINIVLEKRVNKINNDIQSAKKLQTEAEKINLIIEEKLNNTHNESAELIKATTINLQKKAATQLQDISNKHKHKIDESAKEIQKNKKESMELINKQINEITKLILSKLTTIQVTDKEINDINTTKDYKMLN